MTLDQDLEVIRSYIHLEVAVNNPPRLMSDSVLVSELYLELSQTKVVSCLSERVYPRPVHLWSGREGVTLLNTSLDLTVWPASHLVTATSAVKITGTVSNNNSRVSCTVVQYGREGSVLGSNTVELYINVVRRDQLEQSNTVILAFILGPALALVLLIVLFIFLSIIKSVSGESAHSEPDLAVKEKVIVTTIRRVYSLFSF